MRGYISYFKTELMANLQYRVAAVAGLSTQFFWGAILLVIYQAFYSGKNVNVAINFQELVTYVWLGQALLALIYIRVRDDDVIESIRKGTVAYELCRPYNLYYWWYIKNLSKKYAATLLRFSPIIIVSLLLPAPYNLSLPATPLNLILFIICLILGSFIITAIVMLINTLSFFTYNDQGVSSIIFTIVEFLSGEVIPVPLLPKVVQSITYYLPFRLIGDLSFRVYSNNIQVSEALFNIGLQLIWIIILIIIGSLLMKKATSKLFIQGG